MNMEPKKIIKEIEWCVNYIEAEMALKRMSDEDAARTLNLSLEAYKSICNRNDYIKKVYGENHSKVAKLLKLPETVACPSGLNDNSIALYLETKYGYFVKKYAVEIQETKNWLIIITTSEMYGAMDCNTKIKTFSGSDDKVKKKIFDLCKGYRAKDEIQFIDGTESVEDITYDEEENPTQYTAYVSFADKIITITAYDVTKVEPLL